MTNTQSSMAPSGNRATAGQPVLNDQQYAAQPLQGQEGFAKPGQLSDLILNHASQLLGLCPPQNLSLLYKATYLESKLINCPEMLYETLLTEVRFCFKLSVYLSSFGPLHYDNSANGRLIFCLTLEVTAFGCMDAAFVEERSTPPHVMHITLSRMWTKHALLI